jgi:hypothetical protein
MAYHAFKLGLAENKDEGNLATRNVKILLPLRKCRKSSKKTTLSQFNLTTVIRTESKSLKHHSYSSKSLQSISRLKQSPHLKQFQAPKQKNQFVLRYHS